MIDRLDVAFAESEELERNALRALFRVYLDLLGFGSIGLKIFLRDDIWRRITAEGFREASHITRSITISWDQTSLLNLVVQRALYNSNVREIYGIGEDSVAPNPTEQERLFYRIFPGQVEVGPNKSTTFVWMLSRTRDASGNNAPRELIHLLNEARSVQLKRLENGYPEPADEALFERVTLKEALPAVSEVRLVQTLYAEYPTLRQWLAKLEGGKTQQSLQSLSRLWEVDGEKVGEIADRLVKIGFFERRGTRQEPEFWVPFIYRDALNMVQGTAE